MHFLLLLQVARLMLVTIQIQQLPDQVCGMQEGGLLIVQPETMPFQEHLHLEHGDVLEDLKEFMIHALGNILFMDHFGFAFLEINNANTTNISYKSAMDKCRA